MNPDSTELPGAESARENLRVIRQLMERATIYRAILAGPALIGGLCTLVVAGIMMGRPEAFSRTGFVLAWFAVYLVFDLVNTWLFYRDSKRRGVEFPSPQLLHGIMLLGPPIVVLGVIGLVFAWVHEDFVRCVLIWATGYGLGLLATSSFAPASIKWLGWSVLLIGFGLFLDHELTGFVAVDDPIVKSALIMAIVFGLLHVIYGIRSGSRATERAGEEPGRQISD